MSRDLGDVLDSFKITNLTKMFDLQSVREAYMTSCCMTIGNESVHCQTDSQYTHLIEVDGPMLHWDPTTFW